MSNTQCGDQDTHREAVIAGFHEGAERCLRDATWSYLQRPSGEPEELYNLEDDPRGRTNVIKEHAPEARLLARAFGSYSRLLSGKGISETAIRGTQGRCELTSGGID